MSNGKLRELITRVAELRRDYKLMNVKELEWIDKIKALPEGVALEALQRNIALIEDNLRSAEEELRSATLAVYDETGDRKPIDKVEVKIYKTLEYEVPEVLAWCRNNAPSLLIVNRKPFEKTAVEIGAPVEVKEEAKCTIGIDLSMYLKEEKTQELEEIKKNG